MSKTVVPSAPVSAGNSQTENSDAQRTVRAKAETRLDAAFLGRIYRSMLAFGTVITLLAAFGGRDAAAVSSLFAGLVLAAVLLRVQEIGVRALMRPKNQMGGMDPRLFMVLLLPLKFVGLAVFLGALSYFKLIAPAYVAAGFFAGQLVILAKVAGWMLTRSNRN